MYAIKLKSGRYVTICDKCWYETEKNPSYQYTKKEALAVAKQMQSHYVYTVELVSEDGTSEIVSAFKPKSPIILETPITVEEITIPKKSIFKISSKMCRNYFENQK